MNVITLLVSTRHVVAQSSQAPTIITIVILILVLLGSITLRFIFPAAINISAGRAAKKWIESQSKKLRGATFELTDIQWLAEEPTTLKALEPVQAVENARYLRVRFQIAPADSARSSTQNTYSALDFTLAPFDKPVSFNDELAGIDIDPDGDEGVLLNARMLTPNAPSANLDALHGDNTLELVFAIPEKLQDRVKLRYFFESIGDFLLP